MDKWEDLYTKIQEAEAISSNIRYLANILENDEFWIMRHVFSEPARSQIDRFEIEFDEMKNSVIISEEGYAAFHDTYSKMKSLHYSSALSESEENDIYQRMCEGADLSLVGGIKIRDSLIQIINGFRQVRNLPPLDGGLSPLN